MVSYDPLAADDVGDAGSSAALQGRARVYPFRTCDRCHDTFANGREVGEGGGEVGRWWL
jgi:hypothetical protein